MRSIKIKEIKACAIVGGHLNDCLRECIELSMKEQRNILLVHNEKEYLIDSDKIIESVEKQNW